MSVDLIEIEAFKEYCGNTEKMIEFVYNLANGDVRLPSNKCSVPQPEVGDRKWNDETYRAEYKAWRVIYDKEHLEFLDKFGYEHCMQEGGGEGGAEFCEGVFKLGDKYYHTHWTYMSHYGCEYDYVVENLSYVTPAERTITVYI